MGRALSRFSSRTGITWPVVHRTCDSASSRVRGVMHDRIVESASALGRPATSATRTRTPET